jgi:hypothetical protein
MHDKNSTFVIGSVKSRERVDRVVGQLQDAGIHRENISVIAPDDRRERDPADEQPRKITDKVHDMTIGAVAGGVVTGVLGCLLGVASIAIPGLGFLIVGGPFAAILGDAVAGSAIGVVAGALIGMRVPEHLAKAYEERLRTGSTIISIHAKCEEELRKARDILADADEILDVSADNDASIVTKTSPTD